MSKRSTCMKCKLAPALHKIRSEHGKKVIGSLCYECTMEGLAKGTIRYKPPPCNLFPGSNSGSNPQRHRGFKWPG